MIGKLGLEFYAMSGRVPHIQELIRRYYQDYIRCWSSFFNRDATEGEFDIEDPDEPGS